MQIISTLWGLTSFVGVLIAFIPCLGALNWIVIPFSGMGLLLSLVSFMLTRKKNRIGSFLGIGLCGTAIAIGLLRLGLGFGIL